MTQTEQVIQTYEVDKQIKYAGFWIRFCAGALDMLFVSVIMLLYYLACVIVAGFIGMISLSLGDSGGSLMILAPLAILAFIFGVVASVLYEPWMLSSKYQATLGMMVLNIKIVDMNLQPIGFGIAFLRLLAQIISQIIFYIGFLMIAFTEKKQGLHDMMVGTLVIRD